MLSRRVALNDQLIKAVISRGSRTLGARKFKQHRDFPFLPLKSFVGTCADVFGLRGSVEATPTPSDAAGLQTYEKGKEAQR